MRPKSAQSLRHLLAAASNGASIAGLAQPRVSD
jgi:hypothetical protein